MAACPAAASSVPMDSKTISVTTNQSALAGLGGGSKGDGRLRPRYCLRALAKGGPRHVQYVPPPEANPLSVCCASMLRPPECPVHCRKAPTSEEAIQGGLDVCQNGVALDYGHAL